MDSRPPTEPNGSDATPFPETPTRPFPGLPRTHKADPEPQKTAMRICPTNDHGGKTNKTNLLNA